MIGNKTEIPTPILVIFKIYRRNNMYCRLIVTTIHLNLVNINTLTSVKIEHVNQSRTRTLGMETDTGI